MSEQIDTPEALEAVGHKCRWCNRCQVCGVYEAHIHARTARPSGLAAEVEDERKDRRAWMRACLDVKGVLEATRADLAALRDRLGHIVSRYGDAHDAQDCAVLHDLRALLAGREASR